MVYAKKKLTPKQSLLKKLNSRSFIKKSTQDSPEKPYKSSGTGITTNCAGPKISESFVPDGCPNCMKSDCPGIQNCM